MRWTAIWGFLLGRNKDISGHCEERRAKVNENFLNAVQRNIEASEKHEQASTKTAIEMAQARQRMNLINRLEKE